ncbi:TIGR03620 family F420-dependent LLM class oxidoreductase [Novosphingobium mangrovi (ex Huang et al. 2023)]|uniref:TIGR03620 family F420-dependent LLM class oxidoreductase n=1 Tax=Novosphingobium mangrovi (ex Huang et al. 2023) TaxID=2976432 RepID=A0ABT2HZQ8_9SPHN|nr:TIGR03620 family F420-dependent LLM class oxidoreductase [Novosphingobium mangrovi (ex Huang et al. 2023)]MCT2398027.1 TIGR03620 family F420-dependent LLM class oxidoreductase [Novosphingobium mangrovi (ex Huang et al. 2023)]
MTVPAIGKVGLWSLELRFGDKGQANEAAAELDELGYGALWIPGGIDSGAPADVERLLGMTKRTTIATGILNVWKHEPAELAAWFAGLGAAEKARTLLGIGVSHGPIIGEQWGKPLSVMRRFLDGLDAAGMPRDNLCLAGLGPKMIALSGERTAGAHPYLVTPEHTAGAREILGPGKLLAPEQGVILEEDPARARELALGALEHYRMLPNYRNNWLRLGFTEDQIDACDDGLIDALFAVGGVEKAAARVQAHLDAGADHVCMQVIGGPRGAGFDVLLPLWSRLAAALL